MVLGSWLASVFARLTRPSIRHHRHHRRRRGLKRHQFAAPIMVESLENKAMLSPIIGVSSNLSYSVESGSSYPLTFPGPQVVSPGILVVETDTNIKNVTSASVTINDWDPSQDVIKFTNTANAIGQQSYNSGTSTLTITIAVNPTATTVADIQTFFQSLQYQNTLDGADAGHPNVPVFEPLNFGPRLVTYKVNDGVATATATSTISTGSFFLPPVVQGVSFTAENYYIQRDANGAQQPIQVSSSIFVDEAVPSEYHTQLKSATIQITGGYQQGSDQLTFTNTSTIGGTWDAATGTLTLSGVDILANYTAALRSVKFVSLSANPSPNERTVTFNVSDDHGLKYFDQTPPPSEPYQNVHQVIVMVPIDGPPVLGSLEQAPLTYQVNSAPPVSAPAYITSSLLVTDDAVIKATGDSNYKAIQSAVVSIGGYVQNEDLLLYKSTTTPNITATWNSAAGTLSLSGLGSLSDYITALRSIQYQNIAHNPTLTSRTITFSATNYLGTPSAPVSRQILMVSQNPAPIIGSIETTPVAYTDHLVGTGSPILQGIPVELTKPITQSLTVSDSTFIQSATMTISGNYQSDQDFLLFTNTPNITGSYLNGVLTLTGLDTAANYTAAIRSILYKNTAWDNQKVPNLSKRTVSLFVTDLAGLNSGSVARDIQITHGDDPPSVVITAASPLLYIEKTASVVVLDPAAVTLNMSDVDVGTDLTSSSQLVYSVKITMKNYFPEDSLNFTNTASITGSWDPVNGILTLSGLDTYANYKAALQTITYSNSSSNPHASLPRILTFTLTDAWNGGAGLVNANLTPATREIDIIAIDDPSVLSNIETTPLQYTDHSTPPGALPNAVTKITSTLNLTDVDSTNLSGATIQIAPGTYLSGEDVLSLVGAASFPKITASWNSLTGTLTLTGTDTVANYLSALKNVSYQNTSLTPNTALARIVTFQVTDDGNVASNIVSRSIQVTHNDDAPILSNLESSVLNYTEDINSFVTVPVTQTLTITDPDSPTLTSATVAIGGYISGEDSLSFTPVGNITGSFANGVLTLSGADTAADYTAALQSVTYQNLSHAPHAGTRTLTFSVTDDQNVSTAVTPVRSLKITATNNPPSVTPSLTTLTYAPGSGYQPILNQSITITDPDSATLSKATITIGGFNAAIDRMAFTNTSNIVISTIGGGTLVLTPSGATTLADWQAALQTVQFWSVDPSPTATLRNVTFTLSDGSAVNPTTTLTTTITVTAINPPVLAGSSNPTYIENNPASPTPMPINPTITVTDTSVPTLASATVQFTGGTYKNGQDKLSFVNNDSSKFGNISAVFSNGVLTLTSAGSTATIAQWQAALQAVSYTNSSFTPDLTPRTISYQVNSGLTVNPLSNIVTSTITISKVNFKSTVTNNDTTTLNYTEASPTTAIFPNLSVTDPDSTNLSGAVIQIIGGYNDHGSLDKLTFTNTQKITSSFDISTGTLTLTGTATVAEYQTALRSVGFFNQFDESTTLNRTVQLYVIDDTNLSSNMVTRTVSITTVNNPPQLFPLESNPVSYKYNDPFSQAPIITNAAAIFDPDSPTMSSAVVWISANYNVNHERLNAVVAGTLLTASWNAATGKLTITGNDTLANYNKVLDSVTYVFLSAPVSTATRTISFQVFDDMNAASNVVTRDLVYVNSNVPPTVATNSGAITFTQGQGAIKLVPNLTITDPDSTLIQSATIKITGNYQLNGDKLVFATFGKIKGVFQPTSATLTLTGADTLANYQAALQTILFNNSSASPGTATRTVTITVNDGLSNSAPVTQSITFTVANKAPVVATNVTTALPYSTKTGGQIAIAPNLTVTDDGSTLSGATVKIGTNYQQGKDLLVFVNMGNITGSFNQATGILTLTGVDTIANYQAALRSVKFQYAGTLTSTINKSISFQVNDGLLNSALVSRTVSVTK